jgi:hypothetical protein
MIRVSKIADPHRLDDVATLHFAPLLPRRRAVFMSRGAAAASWKAAQLFEIQWGCFAATA